MDIGVIGVNYKSADLTFRETLVKNLEKIQFTRLLHHFSKVVLMTCNRFEVYFHSPSLTETHSHLLHDFTREFNQKSSYKLYSYFGADCFRHLAKVTCGFDSAIFAETEIQGQVKSAYQEAHLKGTCSKELHFLFQKCLKIGKEMRLKIPIQKGAPDLVETIIGLKSNLKKYSQQPKILFVGASKINSQIIKRINLCAYKVFITNRTENKGIEAAEKLGVNYYSWELLENWTDFDGVILATHSCNYLIHKSENLSLTPKLIVDLSVPRNACPKLSLDPNIKLFNIDQINKMARKHSHVYLQKNKEIEKLIALSVDKQKKIFLNKNQYFEKIQAAI